MKKEETWIEIEGKRLRLSNLSKVMYPQSGFTKADVIDYYVRIAPTLLPHMRKRAVTLKRYPDGADSQPFYEKNCPVHRPDWLTTTYVESKTKGINFCVIENLASLVWIANLASLEIHTYLARGGSPDRPDFMAFDLDPGPPAGVLDCIPIARRLRDLLKGMGLETIPKVSGGKGLHIYVPLNTATDFEHTKPFAREIAQQLERDDPKRVTSNMRKDLRKGKIFVDWSQNDRHKTTVCVYSLRARGLPTVSMPVTWEELDEAAAKEDESLLVFEARAAIERVEDVGDLFAPVLTLKQKLPKLRAGAGVPAVGTRSAPGRKREGSPPRARAERTRPAKASLTRRRAR